MSISQKLEILRMAEVARMWVQLRHNGRVAEALGISRPTLYRWMIEWGWTLRIDRGVRTYITESGLTLEQFVATGDRHE